MIIQDREREGLFIYERLLLIDSIYVVYNRTYGIVSIAWHIESGMFVAIKKFKESDDNEYVSKFKL